MLVSRRQFFCTTFAGLAAARGYSAEAPAREIRFGVCADVHKDIMHDADGRLQTFVTDMSARDLDFIVELGDFCTPKARNQGFLDIFNGYPRPKYHVLGNHEIDGGHSWREAMDYLGMATPYYSFDVGGYHFVVLDGNNKPEGHTSGYPKYIGTAQQAWLEADLEQTTKPTVVFCHQALHNSAHGMIDNHGEVRRILEAAGSTVIACLTGHRHVDVHREVEGIHYLGINSMSYYWVGGNYAHVRYGEEIEAAHPHLKSTIPYETPLYTVVTLRPNGELLLEGRAGDFIAPTPDQLGVPKSHSGDAPITASISARHIPILGKGGNARSKTRRDGT
jgi:predicted phosphodiesterase